MKATLIFRISLIFCLLTFFCCSKDSLEEDPYQGTMEAKINGELVIFDRAMGEGSIYFPQDCMGSINKIIREVYTEEISNGEKVVSGHLIFLYLDTSLGTGTYNPHALYIRKLTSYKMAGYYQFHINSEHQTIEEEGEVKITSTANNRFKGTFRFTAVNENLDSETLGLPNIVVVTEGKFDIPQSYKSSCNN